MEIRRELSWNVARPIHAYHSSSSSSALTGSISASDGSFQDSGEENEDASLRSNLRNEAQSKIYDREGNGNGVRSMYVAERFGA